MTGQNTSNTQTKKPKTCYKPYFLISVITTLVLAFICVFAANLAAWYSEGFDTLTSRLQQTHGLELNKLAHRNKSFEHFYESSIYRMDSDFQNALNHSKQELGHLTATVSLPQKSKSAKTFWQRIIMPFPYLWQIFCETAEVLLDKFAALASSFIFYLYAMFFGIVYGLGERHLRTSQVGRESTGTCHQWVNFLLGCSLVILFFYLILRLKISTQLVVCALAFLFFDYCMMTCSRFKKYV